MIKDGFYWIKVGLYPYEVAEIADDGACMYRVGSDIIPVFENGQWIECGEPLDLLYISGPIEPPNA